MAGEWDEFKAASPAAGEWEEFKPAAPAAPAPEAGRPWWAYTPAGALARGISKAVEAHPGAPEAAGSGLIQGLTLGFGPELAKAGAVTPESAVLEEMTGGRPSNAELDAAGERLRAHNAEMRRAHPLAFGAGEVVGSLPAAVLAGGAPAGAVGRIAASAGLGATVGAGNAGPGERLAGAEVGGVFGVAGGVAGEVASTVAQYVAKKVGLRQLVDLGVQPATVRNLSKRAGSAEATAEDLAGLAGLPAKYGIEDAKTAAAAVDTAGRTIGSSMRAADAAAGPAAAANPGNPGLLNVHDIGAAYDQVVSGSRSALADTGIPGIEREAKKLVSMADPSGNISFEEFHRWQQDLGSKLYTALRGAKGPDSVPLEMARDFRMSLLDGARDKAASWLSPQAAAGMREAIEDYGGLKVLEDATRSKAVGRMLGTPPGERLRNFPLVHGAKQVLAAVPAATLALKSYPEILRAAGLELPTVGAAEAGAALQPEPRAEGGPVDPGAPFLVGEEGPEVIVPQQPGVVVPHDQVAGYLSKKFQAPQVDRREQVRRYLAGRKALPGVGTEEYDPRMGER